jgi:sigma-B regulation protein RsbU (phosphoserine phosphatase)
MENIDTEGLPIGIERTAKFGQKRFKLESGDIAVLYTDGIIEAMNQAGEQYSYEKFVSLILENASSSTEELISKIKSDLKAFVGPAPQHDDQTLLLMKVN